jgi:Papain family cysteine protease
MSPICGYKCSTSDVYKKYACKVGSMKLATLTDDIKADLVTNGPMMVGFTIYEDFMSYAGGIYEPTTTQIAGAHAVKLLGWDYDGTGRLFWICQN